MAGVENVDDTMDEEMNEGDDQGKSDDDENSSESSDNEDEQDAENEKLASELEAKVAANLYDYNGHVELIGQLQKMGELEKMRSARERMSQHYPLSPKLWLEWLRDEQKVISTNEEREAVCKLFDRAVKDYLSVDVWLEYVQIAIGGSSAGNYLENVRAVFERAVVAAGLVVPNGNMIWEAYREFENVMLSMLQPTEDGDTKEIIEQRKRIGTIYRRQLACPLREMDKTLAELDSWLAELTSGNLEPPVDRQHVEIAYKKAWTKLRKIEPFEDILETTKTESRAQPYKEYLKFEQSDGDEPARMQCLFERAVTDCPLDAGLWLAYAEYVDETLHMDTVTLPTCERAVRNCPWNALIWQHYIRALERYKRPHETIKTVFETSLQSGLQTAEDYRTVWLEYCTYLRRRLDVDKALTEERLLEFRETVDKACEYLAQYFGLEGDPSCLLLRLWANVEAVFARDMEKARKIWGDILSQGHNRTASSWMQFIHLESASGDSKHLRRLFPRALIAANDWPESIADEWLMFERTEGDLDQYELAVYKCRSRIKAITAERAKAAEKEAERNATSEHGQWGAGKKRKTFEQPRKPQVLAKRNEEEKETRNMSPYKRPASADLEDAPKPKKSAPPPGYKGAPPPGFKGPPPPGYKEENKPKDLLELGVVDEHDPTKDNRTVFVSNLDYSTNAETIRVIFTPVGNITDLRLVKDFKGRSKGYCYVEFSESAEALEALKKDREMIEGRPMYVSRCDPDKNSRPPGFKFRTGLEKNKLFVKGLSRNTTKEKLQEVFGAFGNLKDIRLVTYRNGHSKGLAFVEYTDEATAAQALINTDGITLDEKVISVALSQPPDRNASLLSESQTSTRVPSLGGGPKEVGPRGRSRVQVSLVPRSVQVPSQSTGTREEASTSQDDSKIAAGPTTNGAPKPKSNADFRQLLLDKKI